MKKLILLGLLLCMALTSYCQSPQINRGEYFIDTDPGCGNATLISVTTADSVHNNLLLSTTGLAAGNHKLYIRYADAGGKWGNVQTATFQVTDTSTPVATIPTPRIKKGEYFFDVDPGVGSATAIVVSAADSVSSAITPSTVGLAAGAHKLYVRYADSVGKWGIVQAVVFTITDTSTPVSTTVIAPRVRKGEYFIDVDPGTGNGVVIPATIADSVSAAISVSSLGLPAGDHKIYIRYADSAGKWGTVQQVSFAVNDTSVHISTAVIAPRINKGEYFIDVDPGTGAGTPYTYTTTDSVTTNLLVSSLGLVAGGHVLFTRCADTSGKWGNTQGTIFYVADTSTIVIPVVVAPRLRKGEYFFDVDPGIGNGSLIAVSLADSVTSAISVSSFGLAAGAHTLYVRYADSAGKWSTTQGVTVNINDTSGSSFASVISPRVSKAEYFIDIDPGRGNGVSIAVTTADSVFSTFTFPTTGLAVGPHKVHVRYADTAGKWGTTQTGQFIISDTSLASAAGIAPRIAAGEYFIDTDPGVGHGVALPAFTAADSVFQNLSIPTTSLTSGGHTAFIRYKDSLGKWSETASAPFVVCASAVALSAITGPTSVCVGTTITLADSISGGTWTSSNTARATVNASGVVGGVSNGSATITYSYTTTCGTGVVTKLITINAATPVVSAISGSTTVCTGTSFSLTDASSSGVWSSTNMALATISTTGIVTILAPGTDTVNYTITNTCGSAFVRAILTINATPVVTVTPTLATFCAGSSTSITAAGAAAYSWNPTTGLSSGTAALVNCTATTTQTYTVTGTTSGCSSTATRVITVNPTPVVTVTPVYTALCSGGGVSSTDITATGATGYTWLPVTALSATTGATVTASPVATTTYSVTGSNSFGCTSVATRVINVSSIPVITVVPTIGAYCLGGFTTITASGGNTYSWLPGSGLSSTAAATVTCNAATTTTYTVTGTNAAGCSATSSRTITVYPLPVVTVIPGAASLCNGYSTTITAYGAASYNWSPVSGLSTTTGATVVCTPTITTVYNVVGTDTFGCTSSRPQTISIVPSPVVNVTPVVNGYCRGLSTNITSSGASSYTWTPSIGLSSTTGATVACTATVTTTYTVTGIDSGCSGIRVRTIFVDTVPTVIVAATFYTVCPGGVSTLTASGAATYSWAAATGLSSTVGNVVSVTPSSTTIYSVTGSSTYGCTNTASRSITIDPSAGVSVFAASPTICSGRSTSISSTGAVSYSWSPSTGLSASTGSSVLATPSVSTTYTITGSGGGCSGTTMQTITVNPIPVLTVTPASASICTAGSATFAATGATTYSWSPATGLSASTGSVVTTTPAGTTTYSVTGANSFGCTATVARTVTFNANPVVSLSTGTSSICIGGSITMTGAGAATYTWLPSTGLSSSAGTVVTATPTVSAVYTVTGTSAAGCMGTGTGAITVNALPVLTVTPVSPTICTGATTTVTASGAATYSWSPATGLSASTGNIVAAHPASTTVYTITGQSAAGCVGTRIQTVTTTAAPVIALSVGAPTVCVGSATTIGASGASTYTWSPATGLSATTGSIVTASPALTTNYSVTGTAAGGCAVTSVQHITVNPLPAITLGASPAVCQPATAASILYTGAIGSPVTYSVNWDAAAETIGGFTDVSGISLSGGSITLSLPSAGAPGYYNAAISVSNGSCAGLSYPAHVNIYAHPYVTVSGISAPCVGYSGNINLAGADSSVVTFNVDGGSVNSFVFSGTSYALSTGITTASHTYIIFNASNAICSSTVNDTIAVNPIPMRWLGGMSGHLTEWNYPTNWSCGFAPTVSDNTTISAATYAPSVALSDSVFAKNLTIESGASLQINSGASLNVFGTLANDGAVSGNGKIALVNATAQVIKGRGTIANLELKNATGAAIDSGARVTIGNTLTVSSGTLSTHDSLVLASDISATARIAAIPATGAAVTGKVQVQQYIQGGYRRYRFIGHPFTTSILMSQLQQYIDITGVGGAANGFTPTASNAPSAFWLDPNTSDNSAAYDPGWKAFTKVNGTADDNNAFHRYEGIRLFFRGAKGEGLSYLGYYGMYLPSAVTIKMDGVVNQGPQTVRLSKGATAPANQEFNMVGNPYPSPVDIGTVAYNAMRSGNVLGAALYVWNPSMGSGGQYMIIPVDTTAPHPYFIQANAAFQIRAAHNGDSLNFVENNKSATADNYLFKMPPTYTSLNVYDADYHLWDELRINFNQAANDAEDRLLDATKPSGADFNFYSLSADNKRLGIDARPYAANKIIPLGISSAYQQSFIIRAESIVVPDGGNIYLHDKLLARYILLNPGTEYQFSITKDMATQGDARFELSLKPQEAVVADKGIQISMTPNPATDNVQVSFSMTSAEKVSIRVIDMSGISVYTSDVANQQKGTITVPMSGLASGMYMVEITAGKHKVTRRLIKE